MYHPAKVKEKIEADGKTVFLVETWDRNTFTLDTAPDLSPDDIGKDDVVLLDYYPDTAFDIPTPKQVVSTVLRGEQAERIWTFYDEFYEENAEQQTAGFQMPQKPFEGGYIG